jgi:hypothetical protein
LRDRLQSATREQGERVLAFPSKWRNAISGALWKNGLEQSGVDIQRPHSGSSPLAAGTNFPFVSIRESKGRPSKHGEESAKSIWRDLDQTAATRHLPEAIMTSAEPPRQEIGNADLDSTVTTAWKHSTVVQEARRLRQLVKIKQGRTSDGPEGAEMRAKVVTTVDTACGACLGGVGLACSASPSARVPEASTTFGSLDNSTYNMATVVAISVAYYLLTPLLAISYIYSISHIASHFLS